MADDIEAFLRHAAQRRATRKRPASQRQQRSVGQLGSVVEAEAVPANVPPPIRTRPATGKRQRTSRSSSRQPASRLQPSQVDRRPRPSNRPTELADLAEISPDKLKNEMAQLLRDPKSLRQAIILSEILRRPDFRR